MPKLICAAGENALHISVNPEKLTLAQLNAVVDPVRSNHLDLNFDKPWPECQHHTGNVSSLASLLRSCHAAGQPTYVFAFGHTVKRPIGYVEFTDVKKRMTGP